MTVINRCTVDIRTRTAWLRGEGAQAEQDMQKLVAVVTANRLNPTRSPLAHCPFCGKPTRGPLAGCDQPDCTAKEIAIDMAFVRREAR